MSLGLLYPTRGDFIALVTRDDDAELVRRTKRAMAAATDLPVWSLNGSPSIPGVDWSDHRSYWAKGFPALMVTDTALFRNDRYHAARDTPDTLDYGRMAKVVSGVHAAVVALARQPP